MFSKRSEFLGATCSEAVIACFSLSKIVDLPPAPGSTLGCEGGGSASSTISVSEVCSSVGGP